MLEHCRIVLVHTSHPGNIGSAARAMKTMGLQHLSLVAPKAFPHPKAEEMASGAQDVLGRAVVFETVQEAIKECHLVVGASARLRTVPWPMMSPRELANYVAEAPSEGQVAILFGREQSGLTNEELQLCHYHVHIPSNPAYASLNLAASVQVIAYELWMAHQKTPVHTTWDYPYATAEDMQKLYEHLERVLVGLGFLNPKVPRQLMTRLRRLFNRARPDVMEMNIVRGILGAIEKLFP